MEHKGWYLVAYDISNPSRLGKVHRMLKKTGLSMQNSLFLVHRTDKRMKRLVDKLSTVINPKEDDLRAYPIKNPKEIWTNEMRQTEYLPGIFSGVGNSIPVLKRKIFKRMAQFFKEVR